ncbi:pyrroline-5-carboxylate reductase [Jatrophihabitans fulvus]
MDTTTVALLGGGKMGEALLSGLLRAGRTPEQVTVSEKYAERARYLADTYGVRVVDAAEAAAGAAVVVIAVKPHDVAAALDSVAPVLSSGHLVVSVAAGVPTARLEAPLPDGVPVVRCMPNTPALVGLGMTAISGGTHAADDHLDAAEQLLAAVGRVVRVPEHQLDAVTAVSGSGPAYVYLLVEALTEAAVGEGLPRPLATELAVQTALGAATMLNESGDHPVLLREAVTSPGGTTAAGVRELERHGLRTAVGEAVAAAARRSRELGAG